MADMDVSHLIDLDTSVAPAVPPPLLPPPSAGTSPQSRGPSPLLPLSPLRALGSNDDPFEKALCKSFDHQDPFETTFAQAQRFPVKQDRVSVESDIIAFQPRPIPAVTVSAQPEDDPLSRVTLRPKKRASLSPSVLRVEAADSSRADDDVDDDEHNTSAPEINLRKPDEIKDAVANRIRKCIDKARRLSKRSSIAPKRPLRSPKSLSPAAYQRGRLSPVGRNFLSSRCDFVQYPAHDYMPQARMVARRSLPVQSKRLFDAPDIIKTANDTATFCEVAQAISERDVFLLKDGYEIELVHSDSD